uniref:Testis expressed 48 n=1 Tax=Pipistrellus kuhlii TaxID=59472 RepID=A0A7J7W4I6_PIPKU|nr:testis expressed 48 [Pipistrellus kuhlii]
MACPRKLASKIFCSCCRDIEEISSTDSSIFYQMQDQQSGLQANELVQQNCTSKYTSKTSSLPLRQSMKQSEKDSWTSSSEFDDVPQRSFQKRNVGHYAQTQFPFQSCLIGRR